MFGGSVFVAEVRLVMVFVAGRPSLKSVTSERVVVPRMKAIEEKRTGNLSDGEAVGAAPRAMKLSARHVALVVSL